MSNAAVMPDRCPVRPMAHDRGAARACSTCRSALPGRFATDVAAKYAVPGRAKSNAGCAVLRSGDAGNRVVNAREAVVRIGTRLMTSSSTGRCKRPVLHSLPAYRIKHR